MNEKILVTLIAAFGAIAVNGIFILCNISRMKSGEPCPVKIRKPKNRG